MLRLVTDSHVPPAICTAIRKLAPVETTPLREWHGGIYLHEFDARLLILAWEERVTFVTYDLNTFPLTVKQHLHMGLSHAGMIFISRRFRQNAIGQIAQALVNLWQLEKNLDWTNRVRFLE